jgi:hypothetical protein
LSILGQNLPFPLAEHLVLFAEFAAVIIRENIGKLAAG